MNDGPAAFAPPHVAPGGPDRNVCLWDTLVTPGSSLVHGEKHKCLCLKCLFSLNLNAVSLYRPVSVHLSVLLPGLRRHSARHGPQAPAAYHWWKEGLDQHPGPSPQAPAPKLPGPRIPGQSAGRRSHRGLLHQRIIGGQHQGISH